MSLRGHRMAISGILIEGIPFSVGVFFPIKFDNAFTIQYMYKRITLINIGVNKFAFLLSPIPVGTSSG
jgi:hypothetical protein